MTSSVLNAPVTAQVFLFGDGAGADTGEVLGHVLGEHGIARSALGAAPVLSASAAQAVDREIGKVADGLLDVDLAKALVSGWRKYTTLTEAAKRTLVAPDSVEIVALASHRVTSTWRPCVDLFVDEAKARTFQFELKVTFELTGVSAVVKLGNLVALQSGECMVTATLTIDGSRLAQRQGRIDLALEAQLHPAISLADKAAAVQSTLPPQSAGHTAAASATA